jgi:regulatory protein
MIKTDKAILDRLENKALHYLGRYASTEKQLEIVLTRFGRRKLPDEDPERMATLIACKVEECRQRGYVNDTTFAESRSANLRRQGVSLAGIRRKLTERGVGQNVINQVLEAMDNSNISEMKAAVIYASRRRLGPYARQESLHEGWQNRHLGSFARAGFSFNIARQVMAFEDIKSIEAWLAEHDDG